MASNLHSKANIIAKEIESQNRGLNEISEKVNKVDDKMAVTTNRIRGIWTWRPVCLLLFSLVFVIKCICLVYSESFVASFPCYSSWSYLPVLWVMYTREIINELVNQSINPSVNQSVNQSVNKWVSKSVSIKYVSESVSKSVSIK